MILRPLQVGYIQSEQLLWHNNKALLFTRNLSV